jgi:hypothetical protein
MPVRLVSSSLLCCCADQLITVIREVRFIAFFFYGMLLGHELFNIFYFLQKMCLYKNKLPYFLHFGGYFMFYYRHFISSWKHIGILR